MIQLVIVGESSENVAESVTMIVEISDTEAKDTGYVIGVGKLVDPMYWIEMYLVLLFSGLRNSWFCKVEETIAERDVVVEGLEGSTN
ncbi:hypothetical protein WICPIJ_001785 [Wickerhamomyces pijperi]|uniref:Uncharacterized protein n=1 Tax=Wickerhamomyces pijperi TaxID=599730 RepID=A0A9P8TPJ4_WICPI|nr:hypothetical protein WICPIJ_001785 [Wickerhamomyces pijperi]